MPQGPNRIPRAEWWVLGAAYALALAVRLWFLRTPMYGDEAAFYWLSQHLWNVPDNIVDPYGAGMPNLKPLFWYRPLFSLILVPGALISFTAFRFEYTLITSLLPPLLALVLRTRAVRAPIAYGAALATAFLPVFVVWGSFTFADSMMAVAVLVGLYAMEWNRPAWAGLAFLAACWMKEIAIVVIGTLWLLELVKEDRIRDRLWPLRLTPMQTALTYPLAFGLAPVVYAWAQGGPMAGGGDPGPVPEVLDSLLVSSWLLMPLLTGLLWPRTRDLSILGASQVLFYLAWNGVIHNTVNLWYLMLPNTLVLLGAAMTLDEAVTRARRPLARAGTIGACAAIGVLLTATVVTPHSAAKGDWVKPLSGTPENSLRQAHAFEVGRDRPLWESYDRLGLDASSSLLLVDVYIAFMLHPFSSEAGTVYPIFTVWMERYGQDPSVVGRTLETNASKTLLGKSPSGTNERIRATYADCAVFENEQFVIYEGSRCVGRASQLRSAS